MRTCKHVAGEIKCTVSRNCHKICTDRCGTIGKRAISSPDGSTVKLPAPQGFTYYDTDQDREITKF